MKSRDCTNHTFHNWALSRVCGLLVVALLAVVSASVHAKCQIQVPVGNSMAGTPSTSDSAWGDASQSVSGTNCISQFYDGSAGAGTPSGFTVYAKQDTTFLYLAFKVQDGTLPANGPAAEKLILEFHPDQNAAPANLTGASKRIVLTNFRATGGIYDASQQPTTGTWAGSMSYASGVGSRMCNGVQVGNWASNVWPAAIEVALDSVSSGYEAVLKIPKSEISMTGNAVNLAFAVVNDLGTTTNGTVDAFASKFPSDLAISGVMNGNELLSNPADPTSSCTAGWINPDRWGIAQNTLSPEVYITQGNPGWTSPDIGISSCESNYSQLNYQYHQSKPCKFKVQATLHNTGSKTYRDVLVVVSPHGAGQTTWQVIDLIKNVEVAATGTTAVATTYSGPMPPPNTGISVDGGYLPFPTLLQYGHPCIRVYILPASDNPQFPKSLLADGNSVSETQLGGTVGHTMKTTYEYDDMRHTAQQNISIASSADCPNNLCTVANNEGNKPAFGDLEQIASTNGITLQMLGDVLIPSAQAQVTTFIKGHGSIPGNLLERYGRDHIIVSIAAFGYPKEVGANVTHRIIEPKGGVMQLFPAAMMKEKGTLPIKMLLGNMSTEKQILFVNALVYYPPGLEGTSVDVPKASFELAPGATTVVEGTVGKQTLCDRGCASLPNNNCIAATEHDNKLAETGFLWFGLAGVGVATFVRRRRNKNSQE